MRRLFFFIACFFAISSIVNAEDQLDAACRSSDPVLVYDNFPITDPEKMKLLMMLPSPVVDVSGDSIPDIFHGELVEKLVQLSGYKTERFIVSGESSLPEIAENLEILVKKLETGEVRYSRINFSQETPLKISSFKEDLFPNDPQIPEITVANLPKYRTTILEKIMSDRPDFKLQETIGLLKRLQKLGVPLVVAGGNFGPNYVNVFSLLPGVISVGSLNLDGSKRAASADNPFVTVWRKGVFVSRASVGGVDIDGDRITDFSSTIFSSGPLIPTLFEGKQIKDVVSEVPSDLVEYANKTLVNSKHVVPNAVWNIMPTGLYRVGDLVNLGTITPGTRKLWKSSGKYIYKDRENEGFPFFFVDDGKYIRFDPLGNGAHSQRSVLAGTSYAAPTICLKGAVFNK